ncbi:hypothetical protein COCVIDRAFT_94542, partial [Bipolaris victoriae FI3]
GLLGWRVVCQVVLLSGHILDHFEDSRPRRGGSESPESFFHCLSLFYSNIAYSILGYSSLDYGAVMRLRYRRPSPNIKRVVFIGLRPHALSA